MVEWSPDTVISKYLLQVKTGALKLFDCTSRCLVELKDSSIANFLNILKNVDCRRLSHFSR